MLYSMNDEKVMIVILPGFLALEQRPVHHKYPMHTMQYFKSEKFPDFFPILKKKAMGS